MTENGQNFWHFVVYVTATTMPGIDKLRASHVPIFMIAKD